MRKKVVSVLLATAMVATMMMGCSGSGSSDSGSEGSAGTTEKATEETGGTEEAEETKEDVVYVDPLEAEDGLPYAATELSEGKTIGISVQTHANAFFLAEIEGVKATLKKGGIEAEVLAPDPANDINTQVEDITEMVARGVDVIFVDALDKDGIKPALKEAERADIPVIAIDSNVEDKDLIASIVESDNVAMGKWRQKLYVKQLMEKVRLSLSIGQHFRRYANV